MTMPHRIRFHRPRKSRLFFSAIAVLVLGLAAAVTGFKHPATRSERLPAFSTSGVFSYSGQTVRPDPLVYPTGVAHTGEEIVIGDIDAVTVHFTFRFQSSLPHHMRGTILLEDVFLGDSGWRNAYKLVAPASFVGDRASATATLSLTGLGQVLAKLQAGSAVAARAFGVRLQPVVRYTAVVGGHNVHGTFTPTLPFTLDAAVFAPQALDLHGAAAQQRALQAELHPSQTGELQRSKNNVIAFLWLRAPALVFRIGGLLLAAAGFVIARRSQRRRRDDVWSHEKRMAFRAGRALVDVLGLQQTLPPGSITTEVANFESIVALAVQIDRPILREECPEVELFAVEQPPRLYVYRKPVAATAASPVFVEEQRSPVREPAAPSGHRQPVP